MIAVKNQDNLIASEKGSEWVTDDDVNAPKTLLAALLIFFRDVPGRGRFSGAIRENPGLRESLCELRPILSKMARARSTINREGADAWN